MRIDLRRSGMWLAASLLLASCRSEDPFCRAHSPAEFTPSSAAYRAMSPAERRAQAERFDALALRCRWEP